MDTMNVALKKYARLGYMQIPFKREVFRRVRDVCDLPKWLYQHFYFEGEFVARMPFGNFRMYNHNSRIETSLFWGGHVIDCHESASLKIWSKLSSCSSTVLDVGANTGLFSLVARVCSPAAVIYSFEPISRIYEKMLSNFRLNNFRINGLNVAVSNNSGQTEIYDLTVAHHCLASLSHDDIHHPEKDIVKVSVTTTRLDDFIRKEGIASVDLMKIDVEGFEPEVLEGMGSFLHTMRPAILLEVKDQGKADRIAHIIDGCGYLVFDIDEQLGPRKVERIQKSSGRNVLLCTDQTARQIGLA